MNLDNLSPKNVFKHFKSISDIPHCSHDEKKISDMLVTFAKDNGLDVIQDDAYNIYIKKPASKGYEDAPTVILQGHMDMVCAKTKGSDFDFENDGLTLEVNGDYLTAKDTTLGADNAVAVAMIMAILEDKTLKHPPIEGLITVGEEVGMLGVSKMNPDHLNGDILINIDAEDEGVFFASCAGGARNLLTLNGEKQLDTRLAYTVSVEGLLGGHSGMEIDKGRANAIHLLGRVLDALDKEVPYKLHRIEGGEKMNAIAKIAYADISFEESDTASVNDVLATMQNAFKDEYGATDKDITLSLSKETKPSSPFTDLSKEKLIGILRLMPTGINTLSHEIKGLVESSTNLGVVSTDGNEVTFESAIRSSKRTHKEEILNRIDHVGSAFGAHTTISASYPEWAYKKDSPLRSLMRTTYETLSGKPSRVEAIHAGLECGFLQEKLGDIDIIAFGPNILDVHTPGEKLDVLSTERSYTLLKDTLSKITKTFN
jgi:dipeptidase D